MFQIATNALTARYEQAGIIVRTKAPGVFAVLTFIAVMLPVSIISDAVRGRYPNMAVQIVIEIVVLVSLWMLFRGRFRFASNAPLLIATIALAGLAFLIVPESRHQVYTAAMFMVAPLVLSLVVSENEWYTVGVAVTGVAVIASATLLHIAPGLPIDQATEVAQPMTSALVAYVLSAVFAVQVARMNRQAMVRIEAASEHNRATIERIGVVAAETGSSLEATQSVEHNYQSVRGGLSEIRDQTDQFHAASAELRHSVADSLAAVRRTAERVSGFHQQVDEQNTVVQETTAAVNEMSASLDSVASITSEKREASDRLLEIAQSGLEQLSQTNETFQGAMNEMKTLLEINRIVGDIAAQTNLLSMNASIEAAHAGDHGRGFAVVADEIRKLATTTASNSQSISENLKKIMQTMQRTSSHAEQTSTSMVRIVSEISEVSQAFAEITGSAAELSHAGREIMTAMQVLQNSSVAIRDGSDQIATDQQAARVKMDGVTALVEQIDAATERVTNAINTIGGAMNELHDTIEHSSQQSARLSESVSRLAVE
ncbi:MAG: hypothetical protein EA403_04695 [Spirochaetaceae bacterium]|nr:MAG: hypothetical protein EA403_04695 [Spirochaetaceae bacterium]